VVTGSALALALALVAFAAWGEVNRKARLTGLLVPTQGSLNIAAPQAGVLMELPVSEGQSVKAGGVLLVLHTERRSLLAGQADDATERVARQIDARKQTVDTERNLRELQRTQREQVLSDRIRTMKAELRQADEERSLQQRRVQLARTTLTRNEQLAQDGFVSVAQVQTRQEELIDADARLKTLERSGLALQRDLRTLQGERDDLAAQLKTDLNQLDRSRASLDQEATENAVRKTTVITAPFAGTVTALNLQPGQAVQTGQTLATLVPQAKLKEGALQAQLFAPSRTAGFVRPGQTVYLRYAAYPYQKFGLYTGHITAVSATPFAPSELPPNISQQLIAQAGSNEALYRINVKLDQQDIRAFGEDIALKPGLTLEADVLQERRKVWEWVLEPVLAARQQMRVLNANPKEAAQAGV
jgi:membrane fusion protein